MTDDEKLLEFAGVPTKHFCHKCAMVATQDKPWSYATCTHQKPPPALAVDFRDHVAMECLRRLASELDEDFALRFSTQAGCRPDPFSNDQCDEPSAHGWYIYRSLPHDTRADPADAIFAATLAYLKEREGK